jgi:hypothetical protein
LRTQPTTVDGWQQQGAAITELANRYQSTMDAAGRGTDPSLLASMGFRRSIADYQVSGDGSQLAKTSLAYGAILGIENGPAMGESPSVWKAVDPRTRGKLIESQLAATEYKDWFHVGALDNGYFPLVDFQRGQTLVSLKSVNTEGSSWMADMQEHIYYLGRNGAEVNGAPARMVLDLRVQPGGQQAALPLISYGRQNGVTVIVREFH